MEVGKIYGCICDIMGDIGSIGKDKQNTAQNYKFRGVDDVYNALQPVLVKHRVFPVPIILEERREDKLSSKGNALIYTILRMKYRLYADDGSFVEAEVVGEGMDSGDKSANKAMSVAYKYAMFQILCIPTEAVDPDGETHNIQPPSPPPESRTAPSLLKITPAQISIITTGYKGETLSKLLANNGVTKLEDMPLAKSTSIIAAYEAYLKAKQAKSQPQGT